VRLVITRSATIVALLFAFPVIAEGQRDWDDCRADDLDRSIAACTRILQGRDESSTSRAEAYNNRGKAWNQKGDNDRAIADLDEAIRLDPTEALYYSNRGIAWRAKGDPDRAIADYTESIKLDPNYALAYNNRGIAWRLKGDYERAIADYSEAIRLEPKSAWAYNNRGIAWRAKGDHERAIADFSEAIRFDPKHAGYRHGRCWARATANRDLQQALTDCNEALRLRPDDAHIKGHLGFVYLRLDRLDDSIASYDSALKINPKLAASLYGRGLAKLRKGDGVGADTDILVAKQMEPNVAEEFARYGLTEVGVQPSQVITADCAAAEADWKSAEALGTLAGYEDHLRRFPTCASAELARIKIEGMKMEE
jgi:tetratricopeptide (TPR) repeat protein